MAQADWTSLSDEIDAQTMSKFITTSQVVPAGGGSFVLGFNTHLVNPGSRGYFTNQANFAPTPANKGGLVAGCVKRGASAGDNNFAPMLFAGLQGPSVEDLGYIIGLSDANPAHVVIKKGALNATLSDSISGPGILKKSTLEVPPDVWAQIRLDMTVNLTGEVVLSAFYNDLNVHACTTPTWIPIPGMDTLSPGSGIAFIDDPGGVNSGSLPFTRGRFGLAFFAGDVGRRAFFDQLIIERQTSP